MSEIFNCVHCNAETNDKDEFRHWRTQFAEEYSAEDFERVVEEIHRYHRDDDYYSGVCYHCARACIEELIEFDDACDCCVKGRSKPNEFGRCVCWCYNHDSMYRECASDECHKRN